jgi:hypothetical protein
MWSAIAPPRWAQAESTKWSASIHICTSAGLLGNAIGKKNGPHCRSVPKQRSAVLLATPRGSKPTRSNFARTSSV